MITFKDIREYYAHIRAKVTRSGCSNDWNAMRLNLSDRTKGVIRAAPLRFRDGGTFSFYEVIVLGRNGSISRPTYSYHYERGGYYFRYDRDPLYVKAVIHEECHLHVNQKEPRFKTHAASFEEVFDFISAYFYNQV